MHKKIHVFISPKSAYKNSHCMQSLTNSNTTTFMAYFTKPKMENISNNHLKLSRNNQAKYDWMLQPSLKQGIGMKQNQND